MANGADLEPVPGSRPQSRSKNDIESGKKGFKIKRRDVHNLQRPETVGSLFLMLRVINDAIYRKWAWEIFKAFKQHAPVPDGEGYTSLNDVTKIPPTTPDNMESF